MSTRIRYEKTADPNKIASVRLFKVGEVDARVEIDRAAKTFRVLSAADGSVLAEGSSRASEAKVKIAAKRALASLGVTFDAETRDRAGFDNLSEA